MAEKSGFFNALNVDGVYDRTYNADDYCDNLAVVISTGVLRSTADDLKVTANGMLPSVAVGRAWIKGHYYHNDAVYTFPAVTAPVGGKRYDRIVLRFNNEISQRKISLEYLQGTAASSPALPAITRTDAVYDLVLANIFVDTNATKLTVTDTRANSTVCGWVYSTSGDDSFFTSLDNSFYTWFAQTKDTLSSVTLFKRYNWVYTLLSEAKTVTFNIPQWDADTCFIEVYVNGLIDTQGTDYTVSGSNITFSGTLVAGTVVTVKVYKSIDGTGIESVSGEITELQNKVNSIEGDTAFTYVCINSNDNISLSQIAQAIYSGSYADADVTPKAKSFLEGIGGNTYLAALDDDAQITIKVSGKLGASTPYSGSGTTASSYKWFSLGAETGEKRIIFDFANCEKIEIGAAQGTDNIIFYGTDMTIKNVNVWARCNASSCAIEMVAGRYSHGQISIEDSRLQIDTTGKAVIGENGTFINCYTYASSTDAHALNFCPPTESLVRVIGGTHYAYTASALAANISAVFYTDSADTNAVIIAQGINCPTIARANFYQKYMSVANGGKTYINGAVSTLSSTGDYNEFSGLIAKNKR